jgi:hypothetical protein
MMPARVLGYGFVGAGAANSGVINSTAISITFNASPGGTILWSAGWEASLRRCRIAFQRDCYSGEMTARSPSHLILSAKR